MDKVAVYCVCTAPLNAEGVGADKEPVKRLALAMRDLQWVFRTCIGY
jgi:hypothetical protein